MGYFWCQPNKHVQFMKHKITCMLTLELDMTNIVTNNYPNKQNIVFMYVILAFFVHILVHTLPTFDTLHSSTQVKRILTHKTFLFFVLMDMTLMVTINTQLLKKWIWVRKYKLKFIINLQKNGVFTMFHVLEKGHYFTLI